MFYTHNCLFTATLSQECSWGLVPALFTVCFLTHRPYVLSVSALVCVYLISSPPTSLFHSLPRSPLAPVPLLERLCSTLLYPDEALKASVFYVWQRVWATGGAAQSLPSPLRDRVCMLLMQTLAHACSSQLTINCLGENHHIVGGRCLLPYNKG